MKVTKLNLSSDAPIPLIAALPYALALIGEPTRGPLYTYNADAQLSDFSASRDFSTCREDESVNPFFGRSKSDTKKDD